jgi:hypothetical protein
MRDRFETARLPVAPFKFQIKINVGFNRWTKHFTAGRSSSRSLSDHENRSAFATAKFTLGLTCRSAAS